MPRKRKVAFALSAFNHDLAKAIAIEMDRSMSYVIGWSIEAKADEMLRDETILALKKKHGIVSKEEALRETVAAYGEKASG